MEGVRRGRRAEQSDRPGRGLHAVAGVDVVLQQYRHTMEWASPPSLFGFAIEFLRYLARIGIDLDDAVDRSLASAIFAIDALEVVLDDFVDGDVSVSIALAELAY